MVREPAGPHYVIDDEDCLGHVRLAVNDVHGALACDFHNVCTRVFARQPRRGTVLNARQRRTGVMLIAFLAAGYDVDVWEGLQ